MVALNAGLPAACAGSARGSGERSSSPESHRAVLSERVRRSSYYRQDELVDRRRKSARPAGCARAAARSAARGRESGGRRAPSRPRGRARLAGPEHPVWRLALTIGSRLLLGAKVCALNACDCRGTHQPPSHHSTNLRRRTRRSITDPSVPVKDSVHAPCSVRFSSQLAPKHTHRRR